MGITKTENFSKHENEVAKYAKALASPARIAILEILIERKECICGELVELLPLSQATVSQHLRELKDANLIKGEISGPKVCYCIDLEGWNQMVTLFGNLFTKTNILSATNECC
ncbi:ArsR/SmtB family transcription factor [Leptospira sp. GIMC2001]|uniref:ArsR/SmtB family transcription factor n=1 Tax=Leptospira sp. GIMC2001 TaxID=1513297 RepID=UPI0004A5C5D9|nr:metalloregulator ArsR/SmtB family transcription factor [Leptospira sp. GIMC2001]AID56194.1 arsenical resistance operon repressor [Leptospira sp. GIMC2001]WCL50301.1 metalloregulator ArsR/SmtB family transcription factor [Leptospira sp. GIMC2001]